MIWYVPEIVAIGPLQLPFRLIILAAIALAVLFVMDKVNKKVPFSPISFDTWTNALVNAAIVYILVWKLSILVTDFTSVVQNWRLLLFGNGGIVGQVLGSIAAIVALLVTVRKSKQSFIAAIDLTVLLGLLSLTLYWIVVREVGLPSTLPWAVIINERTGITYHPINAYQALIGVSIIVGFILYNRFNRRSGINQDKETNHMCLFTRTSYQLSSWFINQPGAFARTTLFLLSFGLFITSHVKFQPLSWWGLAPEQWLYMFGMITSIVWTFLPTRYRPKGNTANG